jgi:hypothetical protein
MKKILILIAAVISFSACTKEHIRGSGITITADRQVPLFKKVKVEGSGNVTIVHGATHQVKVTGYENLVQIYETNVVNGNLILKFSDNYNVRNSNISVAITVPAIEGVYINGSGTIDMTSMTGSNFEAEINGSGDMDLINSAYTNVFYRVNGSGHIDARTVQSTDADANISGSGDIDVHVAGKLKARISGSGNINYWGNPTEVDAEVSGSGKVSRR